MPVSIEERVTELPTKEKAEMQREKTKYGVLVAQSLHKESKIDLYRLSFNSIQQSSVFIYPADFSLTSEVIFELDSFDNFCKRFKGREFKDTSMEDLNFLFLGEAHPCIPFMSHDYNYHKIKIIEHSFHFKAAVYLEGVIEGLKAK